MDKLQYLLKQNKEWAGKVRKLNPGFFKRLAEKNQTPKYLWIGCADSRVPANQIVNLLPGDMFVHRNIANLVIHTDFNCLSVIQYAVEILKIKHIIICGHYGCGGIKTTLENKGHGLIDNWLRHVKDVYLYHKEKFKDMTNEKQKMDLLCELNVIEQVANVGHTTTVKNAWDKKQELMVHGWIYSIEDGLIKDLEVTVSGPDQIANNSHFK